MNTSNNRNNGSHQVSSNTVAANNHSKGNGERQLDTPLGPLDDTRKFFLANMAYHFTPIDVKQWFGVSVITIIFLFRIEIKVDSMEGNFHSLKKCATFIFF